MNGLKEFGEIAKGLARNPLGIIALFIVLIYGFASLVVGLSDALSGGERLPLIWFLVVFPVLVLIVFAWLVSKHHAKLYAPTDYRQDESFIQASQATYQAAVSLGAATAKLAAAGTPAEEIEIATKAAAESIVRATGPKRKGTEKTKTVLWVDDRPDNNIFERQALESFGFQFVLSLSTDDALDKLKQKSFDAIISNMGRPSDDRAGYALLEALRSEGNQIPFIIYAGSKAPEHIAEAKRRGAQGTTNRPDELFDMVLAAVSESRVET
jgi:CheY-like chemotaxis protein